MWQRILFFLGGALTAKFLGPALRPITREATKMTILLGHRAQKSAVAAWQDLEDFVSEAAEELEREQAAGKYSTADLRFGAATKDEPGPSGRRQKGAGETEKAN